VQIQLTEIAIKNIDAHRPDLPHIPEPSEPDMAKVLATINHRPVYTMREFAAHCNEFYRPNWGRSASASR
jgi:hypothetical protein